VPRCPFLPQISTVVLRRKGQLLRPD
jgi:hypothetical protein